jgi:hypothetical protein
VYLPGLFPFFGKSKNPNRFLFSGSETENFLSAREMKQLNKQEDVQAAACQ